MKKLKFPKPTKPLRVFYLIEVDQGSVAHQFTQNFLNCSHIQYRSTVADDHIEGLNDLMDQELFRAGGEENAS